MVRHFITLTVLGLLTKVVLSDTNYRLNPTVRPSSYIIAITPSFDTNDEKAFTFIGEVSIIISPVVNTNEIKLHSEDLIFTADNITVSSGSTVIPLHFSSPLEFDTNYTFAYIYLQDDLQIGTDYMLKIAYTGPIREDLNGFYRNYYIENGVKKWLGATQMESTHARKVFPCFDEPEYKAVFTLVIDRPDNYQPSLANTKVNETVPLANGYIREIFHPSPKMSTYLVAFLISEFAAVRSTAANEFGIYTRPDAVNQTAYALDFGVRVVDALSDYFGIDYYSTNANLKLDHVALTDFRAGAMENWGLVKYRESLLLYVPEDSTPYFKYRTAQIMAHETTHMWFGDLVTCHWWSNTWLNEGFADYFQDYITAIIEPEVGSADMLVTGSVYDGYLGDDSPSSPAITNNNVNSPDEISGHFGRITYQKAGSIIRMIHHWIGDESFQLGLRTYLKNYEFQVGYPEYLYTALQQAVDSANALVDYPGSSIANVMGSWVSQAGHPILTVEIDYENEKATLHQKRFYIDSSHDSNETYPIPVTYTTALSPDFNNTKPNFIMSGKSLEIYMTGIGENEAWVIFNIQESGFYRVNYDDKSWKIIANALKVNQTQINHLNRAKIVNDLFAFLYADEVEIELLHEVVQFLSEETDYSVWYAALRGFNKLRNSFLGSDAEADVEAYALKVMEGIIDKLGYDVRTTDDFVTLRNRMQVLEFACKLGHQGCIDRSVERFKNLKENGTEVPPSLRPVTYCNGLRHGNAEDYDFLYQRMKTTNIANEAWVIADALGCSADENKLKSYLVAMLEENSPIRTQDLTTPLTSILNNYNHVHVVLEELQQNYTLWTTIYPSMDSILSTVASALHTEAEFSRDGYHEALNSKPRMPYPFHSLFVTKSRERDRANVTSIFIVVPQFESWISTCECDAKAVASGKNSLAVSRAATTWAENHKQDILRSLRNNAFLRTPSWFMIVFSVIISIIYLF